MPKIFVTFCFWQISEFSWIALFFYFAVTQDKKNLSIHAFSKNLRNAKKNISFQNLKNLWIINLGNSALDNTQLQIRPDLDLFWFIIRNQTLQRWLEGQGHLYFEDFWILRAMVFTRWCLKIEKPRKNLFSCLTDIPKINEKNIS